jgi:hypothetical protein
MNRRFAVVVAGAALVLFAASPHAGPCSSKIAQFKQAVRQSANNPDAGPTAPQSVRALLDRQPTPASVKGGLTPEQLLELTDEHIRPLIGLTDRLSEAGAEDEPRVISKQLTRLSFRAQPLPSGK